MGKTAGKIAGRVEAHYFARRDASYLAEMGRGNMLMFSERSLPASLKKTSAVLAEKAAVISLLIKLGK